MKNLRYLIPVILLTMLVFQVLGSRVTANDDPYLTKEFTLNGAGNLEVRTSGASVSVKGNENKRVLVEMYVRRNGNAVDPQDADIQKRLEDFNIDINQNGNKISVIVENRKSRNWGNGKNNISISFEIQVPREMSSNFETSGGSIAINGVDGDHHLKTSGGSVKIMDCSGNLEAKSSGGSFNVEQYQGLIGIQSSGGSVKIYQTSGELRVGTSGGSVNIEDVSGKISANTSGGGINVNLLTLDQELTLKSSGGSISAVVPKDLGMDLDLSGGHVNTKLTNFDGEVKRDKILGKINGGGVLVTMAGSGGSVNLDYR